MISRKKRIAAIKSKGFAINVKNDEDRDMIGFDAYGNLDFSKIKVGAKILEDAIYDKIGYYQRINPRCGDKEYVLRAIETCNYEQMREISNFFYKTSGIYSRLCRYMAYLYRYDWFVTPYINEEKKQNTDELLSKFNDVLLFLDNFETKRYFGEVALKVVKNGCYYGYLIPQSHTMTVQELPANYCRSRFSINRHPVIEFNMAYFDTEFKDIGQRMRMLDLFPAEFKKGYLLYKKGKLNPQFEGDSKGWYVLDTKSAFKFNTNGEDFPMMISVIPAIIDLDNAQELDRKKMAQRLLKIIIQKMPFDKNGDLIFDVDEAAELHNNAVKMLKKAIGIDVLTTFADVDVADMDTTTAASAVDELEKVERAIYNEAGVSQKQFNTDNNMALEKSILNDEAAMYNLLLQFECFLNEIIKKYNTKPKKYYFKVQILTTTIYNYQEMAKLYKEQTQIGYSKMLPQIALGQSQSSILANAYFENDILDLVNVFVPPQMSSTMSGKTQQGGSGNNNSGNGKTDKKTDNPEGGRPEKPNDKKSEKTIQNRESKG